MKKSIFSLAATALLFASCEVSTKDSQQTLSYKEYNLIVDTYDMDQPAIATASEYLIHTNLTKGVVDISSSDIIVNNQKYSFETDTMTLIYTKFKPLDGQDIYTQTFSKRGSAAVGSAASDLKGSYSYRFLRSSAESGYYPAALNNPQYSLVVQMGLDLNYMLADRYIVQTFFPIALFRGNSYANDGTMSYSTKKSDYYLEINFQKNLADLYIYNPEYTATQSIEFPKIIRLEKIPVKFTHDRFYLEASAPETTVLSMKDGKYEFVSNQSLQVTDFRLDFLSPDITEADIMYKIEGKSVNFNGCSVLKGGK